MTLEDFLSSFPDYARDVKINFKNVLDPERSRLNVKQIGIIAIACGVATKNQTLISLLQEHFKSTLEESEINAAKGAAVIMGMNNIYYRFIHLASNKAYSSMSPGLRMQIIATHGISKIDFEIACLAVSSINGCGACIDSHESVLKKEGISEDVIQESIKIAATINAASFVC